MEYQLVHQVSQELGRCDTYGLWREREGQREGGSNGGREGGREQWRERGREIWRREGSGGGIVKEMERMDSNKVNFKQFANKHNKASLKQAL